MDRHLNIFHAYRHGNLRDMARERVLEDNVTRALITTLKSSRFLTREFLKKFVGVNSRGCYQYDLQSRLDADETEASNRRRISKHVIVIAKQPELPNRFQVANEAMESFEAQLKSNPSPLRNSLSRLADRIQGESLGRDVIVEGDLKRILGLNHTGVSFTELSDPNLPSYLYELTFGSRPDASIKTSRATVLFENKLHGGVTDAQIRRHLRENLGDGLEPKYFLQSHGPPRGNQVPILLWSWNDVYEFFSEILSDRRLSRRPVPRFMVCQLLHYLEVNGMGPVKFTQEDFLEWESDTESDVGGGLLDRMETLGEALAKKLESHHVKRLKISPGYIGVNVLDDAFKGEKSEQVPHWSLGLERDRYLRFYVQCESKPLVERLLKRRAQLEQQVTESLWDIDDRSGLYLLVQHKLFIVPGGTGAKAGLWSPYSIFPLEMFSSAEALLGAVRQMFDIVDHLRSPEVRDDTLKRAGLKGPGKAAWGLFRLDYRWNWFELEKQGAAITDSVLKVATRMKPYYDALVETYQEPVPRRARRKQSDLGLK